MAAFLMGGMAMAQHARHSDKMPEPKSVPSAWRNDGERVLLERYAETTTAGGKSGIGWENGRYADASCQSTQAS